MPGSPIAAGRTMQISKHKVATIDYTLTDDSKNVIDTSEGREPLAFIHGTGQIIPGLESALEGASAGDNMSVSISPDQGYGERNEELVMDVPRSNFEGADKLEAGMTFHTQSESGNVQIVTVVDVSDDMVKVDANHPLAGNTLNFDVTVVEVRDATDEELDHGHVHGPGGHEH